MGPGQTQASRRRVAAYSVCCRWQRSEISRSSFRPTGPRPGSGSLGRGRARARRRKRRAAPRAVAPARLDRLMALRAGGPHRRPAGRAVRVALLRRRPAGGAGHRDRVAQDEVQDDADRVRDEDREQRPEHGVHSAPPRVPAHVADEEHVGADERHADEGGEEERHLTRSGVPFFSANPGNRKNVAVRHVTARHTRRAVHLRPRRNDGPLPIETAHTVLPSSRALRPRSTAAAPAVNHPAAT